MRKRYLIVLFLIVFSLTSFAEENTPTNTEGNSVPKVEEKSPAKTEEKDVTNLKEIVVTATRTEKDVESARNRKYCHEKGNRNKEHNDG